MSVIAVSKVPVHAKIEVLTKTLAKAILGDFESINFGPDSKFGQSKILYIKLSEKLDPLHVLEVIKTRTRFGAFIPKKVPDLIPSRKGKIPLKTRLSLGIAPSLRADKVILLTHLEIMTEMQSKFTGLYNLSLKTEHQLLYNIAKTIVDRLKKISASNSEAMESGFTLSKAYRKLHPHFGDFQLILTTLHRLQDAAGAPRTQISEDELTQLNMQPYVLDKVPYAKVKDICEKYTNKIITKINDHVSNLKTDADTTEEEAATKKIRLELRKMAPYLPELVKQVISYHFIPQKAPFQKVRIYGEPFMPGAEVNKVLIQRVKGVHAMRSDRMYNLLRFSVPLQQVTALLQLDGTILNGAKLVVRQSDMPIYHTPKALITDVRKFCGVLQGEEGEDDPEEGEDWDMEGEDDDETEA